MSFLQMKKEIASNTEKIDFVVTWVDGNDPEWFAEKKFFLRMIDQKRIIIKQHKLFFQLRNIVQMQFNHIGVIGRKALLRNILRMLHEL